MKNYKLSEEVYKKLDPKQKERIVRRLREVFKRHKFIEGFIVFGSFVNRNYFRDVDVAIVVNKKIDFEKISELEIEAWKKTGLDIDIKIFNDLPLTYKYEIVTKGRAYGLPAASQIRWMIVKEYSDFEHLKELNDKRMLGLEWKKNC
jgi:predicted nucleotidyltransferase